MVSVTRETSRRLVFIHLMVCVANGVSYFFLKFAAIVPAKMGSGNILLMMFAP